MQEVEMNLVVKELVLYSIYLVIISLISYGTRDPNAFLQKEALEVTETALRLCISSSLRHYSHYRKR